MKDWHLRLIAVVQTLVARRQGQRLCLPGAHDTPEIAAGKPCPHCRACV